ncbi:Phosphatidylinositol 3,4,5-trisphosphate-dependent Rac exchanger 1 [Lecanosticta acicola]|uniref:Phosphatidylinositol 3,4,5-trisphosphate-dependent Rac exchanger 1 n=1 Tax=Lecanosticta acicola TaxID=111012 RepID=A0AAI8YYV0_9PEZI|nr:Phosphatidylinositol 3,4,5-trisphosphate-dependent Rac exchanger 1 [Lecanosticta acicola]
MDNQLSSPHSVGLSLTAAGPVDAFELYQSPGMDDAAVAQAAAAQARMSAGDPAESVVDASTRTRALNSVRSNPALLPSRRPGKVRDMASRWDRSATAGTAAPQTSRDRYKRPTTASRNAQKSSLPTIGAGDGRKLQKKPPGSPRKSPSTSFETTNSSFSSASTASTMRSARSQPHAAFSPKRPRSPAKQQPYVSSRPLFGEITTDGKWKKFAVDLGNYGPLPTFEKAPRRGSEGSLALWHGRSQSHQDMSAPLLAPPKQKLSHKRSRSEMDAFRPTAAPSMPNLNSHNGPPLYPTPPDSVQRALGQSGSPIASRIPVRSRPQSTDSTASSNSYSRAPSATSNPPGRKRLERSPTRTPVAKGKENSTPSRSTPSRSRYHRPPSSAAQPGQTLSAKIVAPLPKTSPPLRSSRPRQPVSSATTSASRARAAGFQGLNSIPKDGRAPSEQWLGKPYDPQKERSRRKIPELDKINFEERRARIQRAISESLRESDSQERMRTQSRSESRNASSRLTSQEHEHSINAAAHLPSEDDAMPGAAEASDRDAAIQSHAPGLSVETTASMESSNTEPEPMTSQTDRTIFEDESPVLGRPVAGPSAIAPETTPEEPPVLLAPATYQPHLRAAKRSSLEVQHEVEAEDVHGTTVLDNVMQMRNHSESSASRTGTEFADESQSAEESPNEFGDSWGLGTSPAGDHGSIRIMLDEEPNIAHFADAWSNAANTQSDAADYQLSGDDTSHVQQYNQHAFTANGYTESPVEDSDGFTEAATHLTPRKHQPNDATLKPSVFQPTLAVDDTDTTTTDGDIVRVLDYYQNTGTLTSDMQQLVEHRMVDLHRISANGGSDANMIQSLLESIVVAHPSAHHEHGKQMLTPSAYDMPAVTPDTPPIEAGFEPGTVIVYGNDKLDEGADEDEDFEAKIRKADEEWERQQRGEECLVQDEEDEQKPPPPPKDFGYMPRSSVDPGSSSLAPSLTESGLRIFTSGQLDLGNIQEIGERVDFPPSDGNATSPASTPAPPLPSHAPPPPPAAEKPIAKAPFALPDLAAAKASSERGSSELSPRFRKNWGASGSSRPSIDSQRVVPALPGSQSMTSFSESARQASFDTGADSQTRLVKTISPGPEQKRLLKRRHIIKELLDTEYSYHQDLKIIEDIYKATCTPELVAPEDKKVLFGNCDEVERFALHFYDDMRKSVIQVYVPPKQQRFLAKRSSFSTTRSDGTTATSVADTVDDEKDRTTTIGRTFLTNLAQMERVYGAYLRNHDAANQRLSSIQNAPTTKCWLDECHANASDITSAWDLDSLLVKPTQRVAKYPMLLQQLLETTPIDHADHKDLQAAAKDSISMLTRINEAKKRADLVEQIITRKGRKESDVRSGLAKAFGRRTEKLKERVGIAEAFQDPEFDELAHKFGGHFIRLQICMRDVQDYMQRADKAIELINNYANALELFMGVVSSDKTEIVSKWYRYGQIIRELTLVAFGEHKADVQKRVLAPMIQCIKMHEHPQSAINKRKKRIVDYAKCKSEERRGQKPDKKTVEASEAYEALNDTLKLELPQLYRLTAQLVQRCLHCFLDIQLKWQSTWERKLRPLLEAAEVPHSIQDIEPAFRPDFAEVEKELHHLSICNGTLKIEAANFLSSQLFEGSEQSSLYKRPNALDSSNRTLSVGSEASYVPNTRRHSGIYTPSSDAQQGVDGRMRSNSSMSGRAPPAQTPGSAASIGRPWSNSNTPNSSLSTSRPTTANQPNFYGSIYYPRQSAEQQRSPRPASDATYFTARPDQDNNRFSGMFTSALPPEMAGTAYTPQQPSSPTRAPENMPVMFVCASLFEFSIDKTRQEAGYPYLQYVQGEVFDVVAQKGELWLAKNQDDANNGLGWIWEQHFIILSSEN